MIKIPSTILSMTVDWLSWEFWWFLKNFLLPQDRISEHPCGIPVFHNSFHLNRPISWILIQIGWDLGSLEAENHSLPSREIWLLHWNYCGPHNQIQWLKIGSQAPCFIECSSLAHKRSSKALRTLVPAWSPDIPKNNRNFLRFVWTSEECLLALTHSTSHTWI